jgi:hypothetical protein
MIRVPFHLETLTEDQKKWWAEWSVDSEKAIAKAIEAWEKDGSNLPADSKDKDSEVWGRLKKWLLTEFFHKKCAYCEIKIVRDTADAEHFRPKGSVRMRDGNDKAVKVAVKAPDGKQINHPGYFWLAYDWRNLLPSCAGCNRSDWEGNLGKREDFPVAKSHLLLREMSESDVEKLAEKPYGSKKWKNYYYLKTLDLNVEEGVLLINPLLEDPTDYLSFGECGTIAARKGSRKERGEATIKTFNLRLDDLQGERQKAQLGIKWKFQAATSLLASTKDEFKAAVQILKPYFQGEEPFSAAALDYLLEFVAPPRLSRRLRLYRFFSRAR